MCDVFVMFYVNYVMYCQRDIFFPHLVCLLPIAVAVARVYHNWCVFTNVIKNQYMELTGKCK